MSGHTHRLILNLHPLRVSARFGLTSVVVVSLSMLTLGQSAARPDRGIRPIGSYSVSDIENISLTNGNVNLSIPLAALPPVAGGKLSWTVRAIYNSKLWDVVGAEVAPSPPLGGHTLNEIQLSDTGGWSGGGGKYVISLHNVGEDFEGILPGDPNDPETTLLRQYRWKMVLTTPDGAEHELRPVDFPSYPGSRDWARGYFKDTPRTDSVNATMRYYSFDGSYLWAKIDAFDGFPTSWTVYLPDGTKIRQRPGGLQRITDPNGNSIKVFTDTDATGNITTTHFQDEQTGREIRAIGTSSLTGPPSGQIKYQTVGGQEVTIDLTFGLTHIQGRTYPNGDPCRSEVIIDYEYFALRSIVLPQTEAGAARQAFSFSYNSDITDPVNIPEQQNACGVVRPAIDAASRGLGSLSQVLTPNGAVINYKYTRDRDGAVGGLILDAKDVARESITRKTLAHDGITDIWNYDVSFAGGTVTGPDGSVNGTAGQYFYDGDGRRVKKIDASGTTVFVYNAGGQLIAEYHSDPVPPPAGGGGTSYLTSDHLGSTRVVTKSDGAVKARYDYLPFGEELGAGVGARTTGMGYTLADSTKQKFTQKERDSESGLDYFLARYYSSAQGRFTSPDRPFADQYEGDPQSWNLYIYVGNNPLKYTDPFGLWKKVSCTTDG